MEDIDKIIDLILTNGNVKPSIQEELSHLILNYGSKRYLDGVDETMATLSKHLETK